MQKLFPILLILSCTGLILLMEDVSAKNPPAPSLPTLTEEVISGLIQDIHHEDYQIREAATRDLIRGGYDSLDEIIKLLEDRDEEVRLRGIRCLQGLLVTALTLQMDREVDKIDTLINSVSASNYPQVRQFAREASSNYLSTTWDELDLYDLNNIWEEYAYRRIQQEGGTIVTSMSSKGINPYDREVEFGGYDIIIGKDWHGTDHGLRMISLITNLKKVYLLKGHSLSNDQISELENSLDEDMVALRSNARLGVMGTSTIGESYCKISYVEPESAADRAGIQKDDVIIGFQGKPIESFNSLIETIKGSEPGDKVKITILRDTVDEGKHKLKQFELDVTLEPWIDESIAAMRERQKERATQQK